VTRLSTATAILEKQGASLADRPLSIAAGETLSGGMRTLLTPVGERWRKMRKALRVHLNERVVKTEYKPVLDRLARAHMRDICREPGKHQEHARRFDTFFFILLNL
jgi:hypothetical protein